MFVVGLFAMLLHLLAGSGLVRAAVPGPDGFVPELCSSHGAVKPGSTGKPPQGDHDCCKLCAAGAPPILSTAQIAVAPAPTLVARTSAESAAPAPAPASAHRPRGPPATA